MKKKWFRDAKFRMAATIAGGVSLIVATGLVFDWRAALGVLVVEIVACVAYSLKRLFEKKKEDRT